MNSFKHVLVTGGAGYVGSVLVPKLIHAGYKVTVLDLYMYGDDVLDSVSGNPNLIEVKGDMRDPEVVDRALEGCDAVIHLACISNDPSFELDPNLGKSINFDCFPMLVEKSKQKGIKRFIYASSSSVYGVKEVQDVHEELPLEPLTDYSKFKMMCEEVLLREQAPGFTVLILRPATVCGYSPRLRLDLTVNILTNLAVNKGKITVFGGDQMRPNIHIEDMTDLYVDCLSFSDEKISGKIFNAGYENRKVNDIASIVKKVVGSNVEIIVQETNDNRSYHVSSKKIAKELGFEPKHTIEDAITDLVSAFKQGKIENPESNIRFYNIKTMQALKLR